MNKKEQKIFDYASKSIKALLKSGDSPWLEGWICGLTDYINQNEGVNNNMLYDKLFDYLQKLREEIEGGKR